jgi:hypothetical protein
MKVICVEKWGKVAAPKPWIPAYRGVAVTGLMCYFCQVCTRVGEANVMSEVWKRVHREAVNEAGSSVISLGDI